MKKQQYQTFAAYIYVTDSEEKAVKRMYDWKEVKFDNDSHPYYESSFMRDEKKYKIVSAKSKELGMTAAATLTMKLIEHYRPMYVIMPGIAAGIKENRTKNITPQDNQEYGDVISATSVWNYSNGKYVQPELADIKFGDIGFIPRPSIISTPKEITTAFEKAINSNENQCCVHMGTLASGEAVVANSALLEKKITSQKTVNTQGIDMEAYGVVYASKEATTPNPYAIIAKSICDFGTKKKSDHYQKFAAYTSCEFCQNLVDKFLPERKID